jgi:hypothetical protein
MGMPPVQKAALAMLPKLAPTHLPQLYPDYIYSIVRLLRPEHVIEQWQEQQAEAAERAAAAAAAQQQFSIPSHPGTEAQGAGAASQASAASRSPAAEGPLLPTTATVKQPPGQVAQAKFALTSAFLEKVRCCAIGLQVLLVALRTTSHSGCTTLCCFAGQQNSCTFLPTVVTPPVTAGH